MALRSVLARAFGHSGVGFQTGHSNVREYEMVTTSVLARSVVEHHVRIADNVRLHTSFCT